MDRCVGAAARLPESDRQDLAIQALARSETVSNLAVQHGVSRKFVYQQTYKPRAALADAFSPATPDTEVLFELAVTKAWLRQVIVGLTLICRSSYRGVVEFLRDLLGLSISVGCVRDVLQAATPASSSPQAIAEPRADLAAGGGAGGVVVRSAGDQPGAEPPDQAGGMGAVRDRGTAPAVGELASWTSSTLLLSLSRSSRFGSILVIPGRSLHGQRPGPLHRFC